MKKILGLVLAIILSTGIGAMASNEEWDSVAYYIGAEPVYQNYELFYVKRGETVLIDSVESDHNFFDEEEIAEKWIKDGVFTVPYMLNSKRVVLPDGRFKRLGGISTIVFEEGITYIPGSLCQEMPDLEKVVLPESVTGIAPYAFKNCAKLRDINFDNVEEIGMGAFDGTMIEVPERYNYVEEKKEPESDYEYNLNEAAWSVDIKKYKGSEKNLVIPEKIDGYTVKAIGSGAFSANSELESVTIPSTVTFIGEYAFSSCKNLKEVKLSDGLVTICRQAFYHCTSLTEMYIPKTVANVGSAGEFWSAFLYGATDDYIGSLKVTVDDENRVYASDENGLVYTKDKTKLLMARNTGKKAEIPEGVKEIAANAFFNNKDIEVLGLPSTLERIGASAFAGCVDLKKIKLPDGLKYIEYGAFTGCWWLTEMTFGTKLEYIDEYAFFRCSNLSDITFLNPETKIAEPYIVIDETAIKNRKRIYYGAFYDADIERVYGYMGSTAKVFFENVDFRFYSNPEFVPIIMVRMNGDTVMTDSPSYIKNNRTMVPMRAIFEALGAEVSWDNETRTAIGVKDGVEVKITVGEDRLYKNGEAVQLDAVAEITNDRTMVPVRAISEAFGCNVDWDNETKTVKITN